MEWEQDGAAGMKINNGTWQSEVTDETGLGEKGGEMPKFQDEVT